MKRSAEIFEQVVELDATARETFLDDACGDNTSLRAEVESLLDAHAAAGPFLGEPTHVDVEAARWSRCSDEAITGSIASASSSRMIGRYKLLEPVGEGGFGAVWMAEQREPIRRRVAVKIIKRGMDSSQVIARFEAERQALAMMDHPNIARVLDAGSTESGQPYFVMEYIRGVPIIQYCDTERLDTRARLELFTQACHAIQHAHQKGIIHRDIKPSNAMVTLHDTVPVVKVIDFGIAKATDVELTTRTLFTQHHQMIGTPAYMSPEQAEMSGLDIDTRSDVYSLGVLLYELLTGTTPFSAEELTSKGYAEMLRIIREVDPPKPSTRLSALGASAGRNAQHRRTDAARLGALLRGDLDWIVIKCLEKDRTRRYETVNALAEDIRRHLVDEPVSAGPPTAAYRMRKFLRRHRASTVAAAAIAIVLVLGIVGTTKGMLRAIHQQERAEEVKHLIVGMLNGVHPEVARGQDTTLLMGILDDTASRLFEIEDELIAAELHHVIGVAYRTIGAWKKAEHHLPLALKIRSRRLGEDDAITLQSMHETVVLAMFRGSQDGWTRDRRRAQMELARRTHQLREQVLGSDHRDTLMSLQTLGTITCSFARNPEELAEVEPVMAKVLEARRRVLPPEHRDTLQSMAHWAYLQFRMGRLEDAEPLLEEVLEMRSRVLGDDPDTLTSIGNLFELYETQGRYEEALPLRRRSVALIENVLGERHPYTPGLRLGLGSLYMILGRHDDAVSTYEHHVRTRRRVNGLASRPDVPPTAHEVYEICWPRGVGNAVTRTAMRNLATAYDLIGRRGDALALYRELLEHLPDTPGEEGATPVTLSTVAWVLSRDHPEVHDPERAVAFARRAVDMAGERRDSANLHMYLDTLALALAQTGSTIEAIATQRGAIASLPKLKPRPYAAQSDETIRAAYEARLRTYEASVAEVPSGAP